MKWDLKRKIVWWTQKRRKDAKHWTRKKVNVNLIYLSVLVCVENCGQSMKIQAFVNKGGISQLDNMIEAPSIEIINFLWAFVWNVGSLIIPFSTQCVLCVVDQKKSNLLTIFLFFFRFLSVVNFNSHEWNGWFPYMKFKFQVTPSQSIRMNFI